MGKDKISDRLAPKGQAHKRAQQESGSFTPAQRLMRDEMYPPSAALSAVNPPSHEHDRSIVTGGSPSRLDQVLNEVMPVTGGWVTDMAHEIINEGENLNTGFKEWAVIQQLIEEGIKRGYKLGLTFIGDDLAGE